MTGQLRTALKLRLQSTRMQFFVAIAGTSVLLVVIVLIGVRSLFLTNFERYLYEQEQQRLQQAAVTVSQYYEATLRQLRSQGVQEITEAALWRRVLASIQRDTLLQSGTVGQDFDLRTSAMSLTTVHGYQVFGEVSDSPLTVAVFAEGELIASLAAPLPSQALQPVDAVFAIQQQRALWWAGGLAILIAALVAWFLASILRRRLARLRYGTQQLAAGNYAYPIQQTAGWLASPSDEIGKLTTAVAALAQSLAVTEAQRRQFMSDIAHELRTPLTILKGELEAVEDGIRQPTHEFCARLAQHAEQLNRLINDLHTLAQAGAGKLAYDWQPVDIANSLQHALQSLQPALQAADIKVSLNSNGCQAQVRGDSARLQQVWLNLLQNSLRYTHSPGRIAIQLVEQEQTVCITLDDSAPGVAPAHLPRLFERFYRVDEHRHRESGGSGLGLAIAAQIIAAHEGSIAAQPSVLGGLSIVIQLPRIAEHA